VKLITFILSIYILALNFTPCQDIEVIDNKAQIEIAQNADTIIGNTGLELCSPFCTCHCCHIDASNFNLAEITLVPNVYSTDIFSHFERLGEDIQHSLLQPPKV